MAVRKIRWMWEFGHYLCTYINIQPPRRLVHARRWVGFLRLDCLFFLVFYVQIKKFWWKSYHNFFGTATVPPRTWGFIEEVVKILKMLTKKSVGDLIFWARRPCPWPTAGGFVEVKAPRASGFILLYLRLCL
jgi:hypothetical protein